MKPLKFTFIPSSNATISITLDGVSYDFNLVWLDVELCWIVSISSNGVPVTSGRIVVNGQNLLANIPDSGFLTFKGDIPSRSNIGKTCFLYYYGKKYAA